MITNRICFAMYAQEAIPGGSEASVKLKYTPPSAGATAVAVYNYLDQERLGRAFVNSEIVYLCTEPGVQPCEQSEKNHILFSNRTVDEPEHAKIMSEYHTLDKLPLYVNYTVSTTGIYCIIGLPLLDPSTNVEPRADADIEYHNAYGNLPAVDYPKLPFYEATLFFYLAILVVWVYRSWRYWGDILAIQKYIGGMVAFLVVETAFNYLYMQSWNIHGTPSWALLCITALCNAGRNSASFFILLIVSMGYGVVKPSLGDTMRRCKMLALAHFVFGVIYTGISLKQSDPRARSLLILIGAVPLAVTMTIFYIWTLTSLTNTTRYLEQRRQFVKLTMYRRVWSLLIFGALNIAAYFIVNSWWLANRDNIDFLARWWTWRWFIVDCWLNLLYTTFMATICALWRPTSNNVRYGLEQLASDPLEAEFELDMPELYDNNADFNFHSASGVDAGGHKRQDVFRIDAGDESDFEENSNNVGTSHDRRRSTSPTRYRSRSRSRSRSPVRPPARSQSPALSATHHEEDDDNDDDDDENDTRHNRVL
ncbi:hypothetical protein RI367_005978 [Sorochytrium milnesiophthora]